MGLEAWKILTGSEPPTGTAAHRQREWDGRRIRKVSTNLQKFCNQCAGPGMSLSLSGAPHAGDWPFRIHLQHHIWQQLQVEQVRPQTGQPPPK